MLGFALSPVIVALAFIAVLKPQWLLAAGLAAVIAAAVAAAVYLFASFAQTHYGKLFFVGLALILIAFALFKGC